MINSQEEVELKDLQDYVALVSLTGEIHVHVLSCLVLRSTSLNQAAPSYVALEQLTR